MVLMQDLRCEVGLTVGVMTGCSIFLEPKKEADSKTVQKCLTFLMQTLGLSKADLQSASAAWLLGLCRGRVGVDEAEGR